MRSPRRRPHPGWWLVRLLGLLLATGAPGMVALARQPRLPRAAGPRAQRESEHFVFRYDPLVLPDTAVEQAVQAAEAGYARCARVFPVGALRSRVTADLTPSFTGASGYAHPARSFVAIRVPDLEYLGMDLGYVMVHEIAHLFTYAELRRRGAARDVVTGPWSEGMADFAAGGFGDIALADWWGRALEASGLWADPSWLLTGAFGPDEKDFACARTSTYEQPALFIRYLVGEYGLGRFHAFYADYAVAAARQRRARGRRAPTAVQTDPFRAHFGVDGEELLGRWRQRLLQAAVPTVPALRLALHQRIYGALREFELQHARDTRRGRPSEQTASAIREQFRLANRSLRDGNYQAAAEHLGRALRLLSPSGRADGAIALQWAIPAAAPATPRAGAS